MKKYKERIAFRLSLDQREKIEKLIERKEFKSLSHFFRTAIDDFLKNYEEGIGNASK